MGQQELMRGQALSMQWVAFMMQRVIVDLDESGSATSEILGGAKNVVGGDGLDSLAIGCLNVVNFVLPFAIEVALKSLVLKEGNNFPKTHDLVKIYNKLSQQTKDKLESELPTQRAKGGSAQTSTFFAIITAHKDDFIGWRYLDTPNDLKKEDKEMQLVLCTVLEVYENF